jgi:signal transduction histidine kinase
MASAIQLNDIYTLVIGTSAMLAMVTAIIVFAFLFQRKLLKKQNAYREIEKLLQKEELKSAYALIEGQEQERKRIAEDLHDNLGSMLATLKIYSDLLLKKEITPDIRSMVEKISELTDHATDETRRVSHNLDSGTLKHFGLKTAITQLCEAVRVAKNIDVESTLDFTPDLPGDLTLNVYRMVQELFTNTLKHARAEKIRLEITQINGDYLSLIFEDNGEGFNPETTQRGIGLQNIQSRVERCRGKLTIDSSAAIGTHVIIEIPLTHEN